MADDNKSPILNNPYEEPRFYYDTDTGTLVIGNAHQARWYSFEQNILHEDI